MSTNSDRLRRIIYKSSYGAGTLTWRGGLLLAHELPGSKAVNTPDTPSTQAEKKLIRQLEDYFFGKKTLFDLAAIPLDRYHWTRFQASVAAALAAVPYGTTISYIELAASAGHPRASRAVGNRMAANPFPVIIPCHRVIKSDGSPGSYSAGPEWKVRLHKLEEMPFPGID